MVPRDRDPTSSELRGLDLRGVPKIGMEPPLENFSILLSEADSIDFSFGDGCFNICGSKASNLRFEKFKFIDAAFFSKSTFDYCNFHHTHFCFDLTDCTFIDCIFDRSTFYGKLTEYGFTRCSFTRCSFLNAKWKQTYFNAVTFDGCDMSQFQVIDSFATVINHRACINFSTDLFIGGEIRSILELP